MGSARARARAGAGAITARLAAAGTALVLLVAGCGASGSATSPRASRTRPTRPGAHAPWPATGRGRQATVVERFTPWAGDGTLAPRTAVVGVRSGADCWTASVADSSDPDAWRCLAGTAIYDPCLAAPGETDVTEVACARSPFSGVYVLHLTTALAHSSPVDRSPPNGTPPPMPWFMELSNGDGCELSSGTPPPPVNGVVTPYGCRDGTATAPDEAVEPWTVRYAPHGTGPLVTVQVRSAWT